MCTAAALDLFRSVQKLKTWGSGGGGASLAVYTLQHPESWKKKEEIILRDNSDS